MLKLALSMQHLVDWEMAGGNCIRLVKAINASCFDVNDTYKENLNETVNLTIEFKFINILSFYERNRNYS